MGPQLNARDVIPTEERAVTKEMGWPRRQLQTANDRRRGDFVVRFGAAQHGSRIADVRAESLCTLPSPDPPINLAAWLVAPQAAGTPTSNARPGRSLSELAFPCGEGHDCAIRAGQTP
jgi:hypothetical protein